MSIQSMTLLERLRNPQWVRLLPGAEPILDTDQTRSDMREAANEIESLQKQLLEGMLMVLDKIKENDKVIKDIKVRLDRAEL